MKHRWTNQRKVAALLCMVMVGSVAFLASRRAYIHRADFLVGVSCANHFTQHRLGCFRLKAHEDPDFILPSTADTGEALLKINGEPHPGWLTNSSSACPESFRRDGSIGYVYVGDGLRLGDVEEKEILILFCPAENHRGSSERSHAFADNSDNWGNQTLSGNQLMIAELERAIARGQSGEVAYSERAMKVLRSELEKRRNPVK